jgi:quinol monooxygenase YgiN
MLPNCFASKCLVTRCVIPGLLACMLALSPTPSHAAAKPAKPSTVEKVIFVRLKAKPGKEADLAKFLIEAKDLVGQEPATALWFAIKFDASTFGIFDAAPDEAGRQAHLAGKVAASLVARAPELLAEPPVIEKADIIAKKVNKD